MTLDPAGHVDRLSSSLQRTQPEGRLEDFDHFDLGREDLVGMAQANELYARLA